MVVVVVSFYPRHLGDNFRIAADSSGAYCTAAFDQVNVTIAIVAVDCTFPMSLSGLGSVELLQRHKVSVKIVIADSPSSTASTTATFVVHWHPPMHVPAS